MNFGLIGGRLAHSYSPQIHSHLGDYSYVLVEKKPEELEQLLRSNTFDGFNVTIPYKSTVIPYCDELSAVAARMGAVNTIVRRKDGTLIGHNTDYFGFESMLIGSGVKISGKKALVLGSGGTSKTAVAVLQDKGADVVVISRNGQNNYENLYQHADAALIVNTTPVGMYPKTGVAPVSLDDFPHLEGVLDVIYNPARTALLQMAEDRGIVAMNGLLMLVAQAKESAEWFTGHAIPDDKIQAIHALLTRQMENIILIGMPGSGKSTIGKLLAEKTGKNFVDADGLIAETAGCTIPDIFATRGEAGFRALETEVLTQVGKASGLVIATGGGCVTREENYPLLHQNGRIFCIERDLDKLATDGRPLSQATKMEEMYRIRKALYERFADYTVSNDGAPQCAAEKILSIWEGNL